MPVVPNNKASAPTDIDERAWRYMDFAKFISLISRRELYLCNVEILAKQDPHEGTSSHGNLGHRQWRTPSDVTPEEHASMFSRSWPWGERIQLESHRNGREFKLKQKLHYRRSFFVNCWHLNQDDSPAMWAQYAIGGQGVAVTSSYRQILGALTLATQEVSVGVVKYLDWSKEPVDDWVYPLSKRRNFAHEKELRIFYWDQVISGKIQLLHNILADHMMDHLYGRIDKINWEFIDDDVNKIAHEPGIYIPIDLDQLIDEVYVAPSAPDWFRDVVASVCGKYDLNRVPRRSDLLSAPVA
jgi:hypothetical protein